MPKTRHVFKRQEIRVDAGGMIPPRRAQVFELAACGKTTKEIARELEVSPETVNWHLDELRDQFHATNRTDLISQGWMHGILQARTAVATVIMALCLLSAMPMARTRVARRVQPRPPATRQIGRREIAPFYA